MDRFGGEVSGSQDAKEPAGRTDTEGTSAIAAAYKELDAERVVSKALADALNALLVMSERGECPRKLDAALTWRENDELARNKIEAALAQYAASQPEAAGE